MDGPSPAVEHRAAAVERRRRTAATCRPRSRSREPGRERAAYGGAERVAGSATRRPARRSAGAGTSRPAGGATAAGLADRIGRLGAEPALAELEPVGAAAHRRAAPARARRQRPREPVRTGSRGVASRHALPLDRPFPAARSGPLCATLDRRARTRPATQTRAEEDSVLEFDVLIEIPKGQRNKYEVDHETGRIRLDRTLFTSTALPRRLRLHREHPRPGRRPARRAGAAAGADLPRLPDQVPRDRHVPDDRRGRRRRQGPLRPGARPAPGAPARHPPRARSSTGWRSSTSSRSTRTSSPASPSRAPTGSAASRPRPRSRRPSSAPKTARRPLRSPSPTSPAGR